MRFLKLQVQNKFMKLIYTLLLFLIGINTWSQDPHQVYQNFNLNFTTAGLGSNMGSMQPTFIINGLDYVYTFDQNSYYGDKTKAPDTICIGELRITSVDSIINLVKYLPDSSINEFTTTMSGAVQYFLIKTETIFQTISLHNSTHPIAEKIVDILNSNIPADKPRLWLFDYNKNNESKRINYTR